MSRILIVAEHVNGKLNAATARCVTAARQIGGTIDIAVLAADPSAVAAQAAALDGVTRVLAVANPANANALGAVQAPQVVTLAGGYTHVLGPSTTFGKDLMPRVAALLGEAQVSDIMKVIDARTFERPIYAGNAIITVKVPEGRTVVATIRSASYPATGAGAAAAPVEATTVDAALPTHTRFVKLEAGASDRPDLQTAARVISGGRALGSAENFQLIYGLADKLGAGVGASRAAVDAGYAPNDMQVGQTGKIVAPDLYIAVGISGAIQHLAGMKDSKVIVAINKDEEAPIFQVADYGLVADLFKAVPELEAELSK